jgi:hypothetical protein
MKALLDEPAFEIERATNFYDPPFEGWKNLRDCVFGTAKQFLSLLRVSSAADYYGWVARKRGD